MKGESVGYTVKSMDKEFSISNYPLEQTEFLYDSKQGMFSHVENNGNLQISFRKLDIYGFYIAYDSIWDVINDRQSHFG